jgi:hypothetical protein
MKVKIGVGVIIKCAVDRHEKEKVIQLTNCDKI